MNELDLIKAIQLLKPTAEFSFQENDYSTIKWDVLEGDAPTWEEIQAAHLQVKAAEEAKAAEAEAKRQAALDKLGALGLEPDDLKALGL
jgi:parvulin-like peptidyl-prolyl isomerase